MTDMIKNPVGNGYKESKFVIFSNRSDDLKLISGETNVKTFTNDKVNAAINKYIQDGWTPINVSGYGQFSHDLAILFCR